MFFVWLRKENQMASLEKSVVEIDIKHLYKSYGKVFALEDIDINIKRGMFGLLGKNGAGKTTLIKILATVLKYDSGEIKMCGYNLANDKYVRGYIGYLPQELIMYEDMLVYDMLEYLCILSEIDKDKRDSEIIEKLEMVNLLEKKTTKIKELSGGMKRRLGIAQALLGDPLILLFDEPTTGLDPEERIRVRRILTELAEERIVIVSTHIVEDIQIMCNSVGVLKNGKLVFNGPVQDFIESVSGIVYSKELLPEEVSEFQEKYLVTKAISKGSRFLVKYIDSSGENCGKRCEASIEDSFVYWTNRNEEINDSVNKMGN